MRNKLVILTTFALAGFMLFLSLAGRANITPKHRAQRVQGVNVVRTVSFTLKTTNTPVAVPATSIR